MKVKRIIFILLLFLCISVIFLFSHQNGNTSEQVSDGFSVKIITIYEKLLNKSFSVEEKQRMVKGLRKFVRKGAHFTIYLLLGLLSYCTCISFSISHPFLFSLFFCFLYACTDEIHQLFISARAGRILDVCIDTCGASVGILLLYGLQFISKKVKKNVFIK